MKLLQIIIPMYLPMPTEGMSGNISAVDAAIAIGGTLCALGLVMLIFWIIDKLT